MPNSGDEQVTAFLAEVREGVANLPESVRRGLLRHPEMIRQVLPLWHPWYDQEVLTFTCSPDVSVEAKKLDWVRRNVYLAHWGRRALQSAFATVSAHVGKVRTVRVHLRRLGLTETDTQYTLRKRAAEFGLGPCPLFVVYQYRLRYKNQLLNEQLYILTDPVDIGDGQSSLFGLTHRSMKTSDNTYTDRLWLDGHYGEDDFMCEPDSEWVFALKE